MKVEVILSEQHDDPERPLYPRTEKLAEIDVVVEDEVAWRVFADALKQLKPLAPVLEDGTGRRTQ